MTYIVRKNNSKIGAASSYPGVISRLNNAPTKKGLLNLDVCINDSSDYSLYYFNIISKPAELKAGGNIFEFAPPRNRFIVNSQILFEAVDVNGTPLSYELLPQKKGSQSIRMCIAINKETPSGPGAITLVGEALVDECGCPLPDECKDMFNVRWSSVLQVKSDDISGTIEYDEAPSISISETKIPWTYETYEDVYSINPGTPGEPYTVSGSYSPTYNSQYPTGSKTGKVHYNVLTLPDTQSLGTGKLTVYTGNLRFSSSMVGGHIYVSGGLDHIHSLTQGYNVGRGRYYTPAFYATISAVINSTEAEVTPAYIVKAVNPGGDIQDYPATFFDTKLGLQLNWNETSASISYTDPTAETTTMTSVAKTVEQHTSYADITIHGLKPLCGIATDVEVYVKSNRVEGSLTKLTEFPIEPSSINIDDARSTGEGNTQEFIDFGVFDNQSVIAKYWDLGMSWGVYSGFGDDPVAQPVATKNDDYILNGVKLTVPGGTSTWNQDRAVFHTFSPKAAYQKRLAANTSYFIEFDAYTDPVASSSPNAVIDVYISGSGVSPTNSSNQAEASLGEHIGSVINSGTAPNGEKFIGNSFEFKTKLSGVIKPTLVVRTGTWTIANITVNSATGTPIETGVTPNTIRTLIPMPAVTRFNDQYMFELRYKNKNGSAKVVSRVENAQFEGNDPSLFLSSQPNSTFLSPWFNGITALTSSKNVFVTGSLFVSGTIFSNEFHTNIVSSSIVFKEGSTIFGDTADDTHHFTGNITASGNISGSGLLFFSASHVVRASSITNQGVLVYDSGSGRVYMTGSYGGSTGGGEPADHMGDGFVIRDDDDDSNTITENKYIKFISATGPVGTNWSSAGESDGSTSTPWIMTITSPDTVYTHPTDKDGDDIDIDTTALTGAVIISDLDINITTDTAGHVTDANGVVATRTLTLANLGYSGDTDAKDDQTDAEIRTAVENASDSNVFTDTDHTKLDGIDVRDTTITVVPGKGMAGENQPFTLNQAAAANIALSVDASQFAGTGLGATAGGDLQIESATVSNNAAHYVPFIDNLSGANQLQSNRFLQYNPGTQTLTVGGESVHIHGSGSITASKNIWVSGSSGAGAFISASNLISSGHITASGNISSSGIIIAKQITVTGGTDGVTFTPAVTISNAANQSPIAMNQPPLGDGEVLMWQSNRNESHPGQMVRGTIRQVKKDPPGGPDTSSYVTIIKDKPSIEGDSEGGGKGKRGRMELNQAAFVGSPGIFISSGSITFYTSSVTSSVGGFATQSATVRMQNLKGDDGTSFVITGSQSAMFYFSGSTSGKIGIGTTDPTAQFEVAADEHVFRRRENLIGLKINNEGNVESFNKDSAFSATGSEVILSYTAGGSSAVPVLAFAKVLGMEETEVEDIRDNTFGGSLVTWFNALRSRDQSKLLYVAEQLGEFGVGADQVGNIIGSVRWMVSSGSAASSEASALGDRSAGEVSAIRTVITDADANGTIGKMQLRVADSKTSGAKTRIEIHPDGSMIMSGSLLITKTLANSDTEQVGIGDESVIRSAATITYTSYNEATNGELQTGLFIKPLSYPQYGDDNAAAYMEMVGPNTAESYTHNATSSFYIGRAQEWSGNRSMYGTFLTLRDQETSGNTRRLIGQTTNVQLGKGWTGTNILHLRGTSTTVSGTFVGNVDGNGGSLGGGRAEGKAAVMYADNQLGGSGGAITGAGGNSYTLFTTSSFGGHGSGKSVFMEKVGILNTNPSVIGLTVQGEISSSGNITTGGTISPSSDNSADLGTAALRWRDVYSVSTTTGGVFEVGLRTRGLKDLPTGTIVTWKNGKCIPCYKAEDLLVMGVTREGKDEPIVLGAEHILVTGTIKEGEYIVTSDKLGHGKSVNVGYLFKKNLFGKVIGQALESSEGSSSLIKCMIRKM